MCRIVVDWNSTKIKWQMYSNIFISPMDSDFLSLERLSAMIKLSFCWSISSTTPALAFSDAGQSMQWTMSMGVSLTSAGNASG